MMKIIISPAKTMRDNEDVFDVAQKPIFIKEAETLLKQLKPLSVDELMSLMKCNRKIAELNWHRFQTMDLNHALLPALFTYDGLQYKSMAPHIFTEEEAEYIQNHLVILSGFYGMLRPMDGVRFYRLEMQTELSGDTWNDLYDFWGDKIYQKLKGEPIINLASKEYSKVIEDYLQPEDRFITCVFGELVNGKVKVKGTLAKMARGAMVRWMAENQVTEAHQLKKFNGQGFVFCEALSNEAEYVYIKE